MDFEHELTRFTPLDSAMQPSAQELLARIHERCFELTALDPQTVMTMPGYFS